jgi:hypothetical protein
LIVDESAAIRASVRRRVRSWRDNDAIFDLRHAWR